MQPDASTARTYRFLVIVWPALALLACAVLWYVTVARATAERGRAQEQVIKETAAYAEAYEQYITRSVGQMDQIAMQLKYSWEHSGKQDLLEQLKRDGMFTDTAFVAVGLLDRDGIVRSSTRPSLRMLDLSKTSFFAEHKNSISTALRVGEAPAQLGLVEDVVLFTRRLDTADDEFAGVVLLAVDARYFTSFVSRATLGPDSMLALAGTESKLRICQRGRTGRSLAKMLPDEALWAGGQGVRLVQGRGGFADGAARVLAWRRSPVYPLVALVALSHRHALSGVEGHWLEVRDRAVVAGACLLLIGAAGALLFRRAAVREREQSEVRRAYRTATESANDGFYMAAAVRNRAGQIVDFTIVDCNERGANFYGMARTELVGLRVSSIDRGVLGAELLHSYRAAMSTGFHEEDRRMPPDDRLQITWGRRRLVRVGEGLAITLQDISERKAHQDQMERMANEDSLTRLPNRHWLLHFLPSVLERARTDGATLALLFIDLDEFKQVNDSHGHPVGDRLLAAAAQRLTALLRPADRIARFGGDEFVVLLHPAGDESHVAAVGDRIVNAFRTPFSLGDGIQAVVGASIGISMFPRHGDDVNTLIRHADIAMYAGKHDGKGQHRFFDQSLSGSVMHRAQLKQRLLEAVEQDQFVLHYQPRVDPHTGQLLSMEALLRWNQPQAGMVAPGDFIPLAESSGLIVQIGELVIDKACAQLAAWRDEGVMLVPVSINVSAKQFARGGVKLRLEAALERHGMPGALLEVEITESAMMGDQEAIIAELAGIRALGVKLHVDDFGTGYSSLSQLQRLRMDVLKVDRAFTARLDNSREGRVFFEAIVSMAHALGMTVVAEGVETSEQLRILQELGCNEVQGFYIAKPMPAAVIAERFLAAAPLIAV